MTLRRRRQLGAATRVGPAFPTKREAATEGASPARHDGRGARATRRCSRHNSHCNSRDPRGATVYTNAPKRRREAISTDLCTLLCPHGRSCDRSAGRFLEQRALQLGGERAGVERSGPSGSVTHTRPHAQGRVAVQLTLPNGIERTEAVRSGSSGSAIGTLKGEWQCSLHCHSAVNVW